MNRIALMLALAAPLTVNAAQTTPAKPATKPTTTAAPKSATAPGAVKKPAVAGASAIKLPPGVPAVKGLLKTAFALKYQDISIGTGALAESGKLYKVHYTGYLASDGKKFDSSFDHKMPVMDKDGKPEMDADGKPKMGEGQPIQFPQGRGRVIPGWDQGFEGMKIGGKRRIFIPYQLAYGAMGRPPVIPAKSDLIFDVELVDITDLPTAPQPGMPGMQGGRPMPGGMAPKPAAPGSAAATPSAPATAPAAPPADKPASPPQPK